MSAVEDSKHLGREENILFWICCLITVVITCIIFLNFIVAEACASYSKVVETLDTVIWKEKTALISECEQTRKMKKYPSTGNAVDKKDIFCHFSLIAVTQLVEDIPSKNNF